MKDPAHIAINEISLLEEVCNIGPVTLDIGKFLPCPNDQIWLVKKGHSRINSHVRRFPMLAAIGQGYGYVKLSSLGYTIKAYSHLVHGLKAYSSNISGKMPSNNKLLLSKGETLKGLRRWLGNHQDKLSHLRWEVRTKQPTIAQCFIKARDDEIFSQVKIEAILGTNSSRFVSINDYLAQIDQMMSAAENQVWVGRGTSHVDLDRLRRYRDILNAFGFSVGKVSSYENVDQAAAWWNSDIQIVPTEPNPNVVIVDRTVPGSQILALTLLSEQSRRDAAATLERSNQLASQQPQQPNPSLIGDRSFTALFNFIQEHRSSFLCPTCRSILHNNMQRSRAVIRLRCYYCRISFGREFVERIVDNFVS